MRKIEKSAEFLFYFFFASLIFSNTLAQTLAIVLITLWIVRWIVTRKFVRNPLDLPVVIFLFIRTVSCFSSINRAVSFRELYGHIFFYLIYFAFTNLLKKGRENALIYRYTAILIYSGVVSSIYGSLFFFSHNFIVKAQSTAGGITRFSEYTMIVFCLAFVLSHRKNIFPSKIVAYLSIGFLGIGLIFAQERAQWLGIAPVVLVEGLKNKRWMLGYVVVVFGASILFLTNLRKRVISLLHPLSNTSGRLVIWRGARGLLFKRPLLGFGPNTYSDVSPFLNDRGSWHSDYLQIYMESGILGFVSYIFLSFMLFLRCVRICRDKRNKDIGFAILFALVSMYTASFFSGHIQEPIINPLFFSLIGFVSVLSRRSGDFYREMEKS